MKIAIGADHGGYKTKEQVKALLQARGVPVSDLGCFNAQSVDYPDYARAVSLAVTRGEADQGILVCTTGIGMSIAANKFPGIRAALCLTPRMAETARTHNDANVLVLAGHLTPANEVSAIVETWTANSGGTAKSEPRHLRRVQKLTAIAYQEAQLDAVLAEDPELFDAMEKEIHRQQEQINLIASENYVSPAVRQTQGCVMTNKYAEGYPGKRYYNGCDFVDVAERLAIERVTRLFAADHANVQPHCGSSANMAVYFAALQPGDTILAMSLAHGGHLTHGHKVNFSGRLFNIVSYGVRRDTQLIDYDEVERLAIECKPKLLVVGASAYPRILDFERFRRIADRAGALLMVDMAHIAGLVAGGCHPNPVPVSDFVTSTTHKTLRGPRSGLILCRQSHAAEVDRQVFPGIQGGPLMHTIASKAMCFQEALLPSFKAYARQIVSNASAMAGALMNSGFKLVSGGTENHLMLLDLSETTWTGKDAAAVLDQANIIVNKNAVPFDTRSPFVTSGIRIGTPAMTTRGMKESDAETVGLMIAEVLKHPGNESVIRRVHEQAAGLAARFPVW
jgi:glycine hydroxymethyltransferase